MSGSSGQLDQGALDALRVAEEESRRLGAVDIGTEHLLLGLMRDADGVGARVLSHFGVDRERVRSAVEFMASARPAGGGWRMAAQTTRTGEQPERVELTPRPAGTSVARTPRVERAIELAGDEARGLGHTYVGTGHLLLGLFREGDNMATGVLASLGVRDIEAVRARVLEESGHSPSP